MINYIFLAVVGAPWVFGVTSRKISEDDGGEEAGLVPRRRLQWGGGVKGSQVIVRAS